MKTAFYIARKYLFAKKSHSIINLISGISVFGIFISTAAMVIVLSGFNGIESLVSAMYSSFDPEIKITAANGKTFSSQDLKRSDLEKIEGIAVISATVEEITMLKKGEKWATATLKGVEKTYFETCDIESKIYTGEGFNPSRENQALIGMGLNIQIDGYTPYGLNNSITAFGLLRTEKLNLKNEDAVLSKPLEISGVFSINPDFDNKYIIVPLKYAQSLLGFEEEITAYEIKIGSRADINHTANQIKKLAGEKFEIKTRYEQNELLFKTNETEKWMVFMILGFILLLSTFNIIASLTMLILDKKKDIKTIIAIGGTLKLVKNIFFIEGILINLTGGIIGIFTGLVFCFLQQKYHLIALQNAVIDHWPVQIKWTDIVLIFGSIVCIGVVSSYIPVKYLTRKHFSIFFNT